MVWCRRGGYERFGKATREQQQMLTLSQMTVSWFILCSGVFLCTIRLSPYPCLPDPLPVVLS